MMQEILKPLFLNNTLVKNRVVYPPCVLFHYPPVLGGIGEDRIEFYTKRAADGIGLIILEATAVAQDGRLAINQPGIYDDQQIDGLRNLVRECHKHEAVVVVQIHHAGLKVPVEVASVVYGPSVDENTNSQALTLEQLDMVIEQFVQAAKRCYQAGADGVEIHGAHGYLLNQFTNPLVNQRTDAFGGNIENRTRIIKQIIDQIRLATDEHFIIGIRMGGNDPTIEEGLALARQYESYGVHYLHVSSGMLGTFNTKPPEFNNFSDITWLGAQIKAQVNIPVIVVNTIKTLENGEWLIANNHADMVAYGRNILLNSHWFSDSLEAKDTKHCLHCTRCVWRKQEQLCPANIKWKGV